ncbi:MAG: DNRLRE domain-containing protein, partial [Planctomycetota bacterium]
MIKMSSFIVGLAVVCVLWLNGPLQATTVVFQVTTPNGDSISIRDTNLRSDGESDGTPWADGNLGTVTGEPTSSSRLYPDVGHDPAKGPRHTMFWFDLSSIPGGATINSATLSVYFENHSVGGSTTGYTLGRLQAPWIEGVTSCPASPGEPTWNNREHDTTPWDVAGATGGNDIDATITFDAGPISDHWEEFTITNWVQNWVDGSKPNNGVIIFGGANMSGYYAIFMSEYPTTSLRPLLTVTYNESSEPPASIDLGTTNNEYGITCPNAGDGNNTPVTVGSIDCRRNDDPGSDLYFYFDVSNSYAFEGNRPEVDITIHYFDASTSNLELQYDATGGAYTSGGVITLTGTNTWKEHTWHVTNAFFGDRQNNNCDFRISGGGGGHIFYLDLVQVIGEEISGPPIIAEVSPDPDIATEGVQYAKQLGLVQGAFPVTWTVVQGQPNTQVSSNGLVSGWTPDESDVAHTYTFEIEASNSYGSDTESWQVYVASSDLCTLVLNDPLQGSTIGTRSGGSFASGGWQVDNDLDYIYWHITPTISHGAFEYDVKGISDCQGAEKKELSHMYDWTYNNADTNYLGYRNNPYKHFVRRQCRSG